MQHAFPFAFERHRLERVLKNYRGLLQFAALFLLSCSFQQAVAAELSHHPKVAGFERFIDAEEADVALLGRVLLGELNCTSCHQAGAEWKELLLKKPAPNLDEVGSRARPDWIRLFLAKPHATKPGTTMPDVLGSLSEADRTAAAEALTHFLASTGTVNETIADRRAAVLGQAHFQKVGCAVCHQSLDSKSPALETSVPLPDVSNKYSLESLTAFLKDPQKARAGGRMPALGLKDEEYREIASYFLRGANVAPNVNFAAYQGSWETIPDFSQLKPTLNGTCAGIDITASGRKNGFGMRFTAFLRITKAGDYKFTIGSDDGSRLTINGEKIAEHDGIHPYSERSGKTRLEVGMHPVIIDYFDGAGETGLRVELEGAGLSRQLIDGHLFLTKDSEAVDLKGGKQPGPPGHPARFATDANLAAKGKTLFSELGCASCHAMKHGGQTLASSQKSPELLKLNPANGCLAEAVPAKLPNYGLSAKQRKAITLALQKRPDQPRLTPAEQIHQTLVEFNCYACHVRGEIGGPEEARNDLFTTNIKEMGDEARIPPHLTGVGDKLKTEWLKKILNDGANDRAGYMHVRMPKFGGNNVGSLPEAFATLDQQIGATLPKWDHVAEYSIKAEGRKLVGAQALSCIKCHDFGQHPSTGIRAINLLSMTNRLREDWFHRYLMDPQEYRRGTRMPTSWPFGRAANQEVFAGDPPQQIAAIWTYLADGNKAAVPVGIVREPIELIATTEPVIYRNFIEGAGSRAIGVGYPGQVNLAYDANDMRLALIWHGQFIDASRHWNGRGVGYEGPLGDHVIPLVAGMPLAKLASPNESWPSGLAREQGFHFTGYQLNDRQEPTFNYRFESVAVADSSKPVLEPGKKYPNLERTLKFTPQAATDLYFRAVSAGKITKQEASTHTYQIDGTWTLQITGSVVPMLRDSNGKQELLIPVRSVNSPVTVVLKYVW